MVTPALTYGAMIRARACVTILAAAALVIMSAACRRAPVPKTSNGVPLLAGALVPASTTMVTAWDIPANPLADRSLDDSRLSKDIRRSGRLYSLNDRIVDCFWRSENATGTLEGVSKEAVAEILPSPTSKEV